MTRTLASSDDPSATRTSPHSDGSRVSPARQASRSACRPDCPNADPGVPGRPACRSCPLLRDRPWCATGGPRRVCVWWLAGPASAPRAPPPPRPRRRHPAPARPAVADSTSPPPRAAAGLVSAARRASSAVSESRSVLAGGGHGDRRVRGGHAGSRRLRRSPPDRPAQRGGPLVALRPGAARAERVGMTRTPGHPDAPPRPGSPRPPAAGGPDQGSVTAEAAVILPGSSRSRGPLPP